MLLSSMNRVLFNLVSIAESQFYRPQSTLLVLIASFLFLAELFSSFSPLISNFFLSQLNVNE